jgi:hypothetical protein
VAFNETALVLTIATLAVGFVFVPREHRRLVLVALFCALISAAIVVFAPGNAARQEREALDLPPIWTLPARSMAWETLILLRGLLLGLVLVALIGRVLPRRVIPEWNVQPIYVVGGMLALSFVTLVPSVYAIDFVESRVTPTVLIPVAIGTFLLPIALKGGPTPRLHHYQLGVLCFVLMVFALLRFAPTASALKDYGQRLSEQDEMLRTAAAGSDIVIETAHSPFDRLWEIRSDPHFGMNQCVASYYDLASIRRR